MKHRGAAFLVVEDLGMLATRKAGKLNAQEELIHALDALVAEDRWVVVTASVPPAALPGVLPALQSRLTAGLTIPLAPPGVGCAWLFSSSWLRSMTFRCQSRRPTCLPTDLPARRRSWPARCSSLPCPPGFQADLSDIDAARQYVAKRGRRHRPSLHEIALATARHFSLRLADLRSPVRRRALVVARGVAVYLARQLTEESLQQIGGYFGGRDHSTVMHSCRKTEDLLGRDPAVREAIDGLKKTLWKK